MNGESGRDPHGAERAGDDRHADPEHRDRTWWRRELGLAPPPRAALPGELCVCGRPAVLVYHDQVHGPTGHCGRDDDLRQVRICPFCGGQLDHRHYSGYGDKAPGATAASGRCPWYRMHLTDPIPARAHDDSETSTDG